jgi:hypothetical protein
MSSPLPIFFGLPPPLPIFIFIGPPFLPIMPIVWPKEASRRSLLLAKRRVAGVPWACTPTANSTRRVTPGAEKTLGCTMVVRAAVQASRLEKSGRRLARSIKESLGCRSVAARLPLGCRSVAARLIFKLVAHQVFRSCFFPIRNILCHVPVTLLSHRHLSPTRRSSRVGTIPRDKVKAFFKIARLGAACRR